MLAIFLKYLIMMCIILHDTLLSGQADASMVALELHMGLNSLYGFIFGDRLSNNSFIFSIYIYFGILLLLSI